MQSTHTRKQARWVRWSVLAGVLALSTALGLMHASKTGTFVPVGVDALCPFGGVEALWALLTSGALIQRIALSSVILLVATVLVALVAGRAFCGQLCPLGTLQGLFGRLGRRLGLARATMPQPLDRYARWLKYAVLVAVTGATWTVGSLVFRAYDPWAAYHHLTSAELMTEFAVGTLVLGVTLIGSLVYERFFCRYACPMGAFLGLISGLSWFKVRRAEESCTNCGVCDTACPVGIDVSCASHVDSTECISCGECVVSCPKPGALTLSDHAGRVIAPVTLTLATVVVFFGVIGISTAAEQFEWQQPTPASEARRIEAEGGAFDTQVIKGSTTMDQVAEATGIAPETLAQTFGIPVEETDVPLKEIKDTYGFTMYDVRAFVAEQLGIPAPTSESH